jgi:hypothetical protein
VTTRLQTSRAITLQDRLWRLWTSEARVRWFDYRGEVEHVRWLGPGYYYRRTESDPWEMLGMGIGRSRTRVVRWERDAGIRPRLPTAGEVLDKVARGVDLALDIAGLIRR